MAVSSISGVYKGVVVDVEDPVQLNRIKVRVPVIHGPVEPEKDYKFLNGINISKKYVRDEQLPWAEVILPPGQTFADILGTNDATVPDGKLNKNTIVWVTYAGSSINYPIISGITDLMYGVEFDSTLGGVTKDGYNSIIKHGANKVLATKDYIVTSPFGPRWGTNHNGIDLVGEGRTTDKITAFQGGKVIIKKYSPSAGNYVIIQHNSRYQTKYMHMAYFNNAYKLNDTIAAGTELGMMGNTGNSFGAHLHFEVRDNGTAVNPLPFLQGTKSIP